MNDYANERQYSLGIRPTAVRYLPPAPKQRLWNPGQGPLVIALGSFDAALLIVLAWQVFGRS